MKISANIAWFQPGRRISPFRVPEWRPLGPWLMPETLILPLKTLFLTSQLLRKLQSHLLQSHKQRLHPLPSPRTNLRKNPANLKKQGKERQPHPNW